MRRPRARTSARKLTPSGRVPFMLTLAPTTMDYLDIMSKMTARPINLIVDQIVQSHFEVWRERQRIEKKLQGE